MLKRVAHSLGLVQHPDRKSRRKKQLRGGGVAAAKASSQDLSLQSESIFVKIVHEGGQKELYQHAVPASKLMEKYPGMCIALPEVFKDPHQSVLWPEETLMPGHKYIIISCKAVEKLKSKYPEDDSFLLETKITKDDDGKEKGQEIFEAMKSLSPSKIQEEAFCSAKDLHVSEEKYTTHPKRKGMRGKKKPFVPPLPKSKSFRSFGWQPSLSPVEELSA